MPSPLDVLVPYRSFNEPKTDPVLERPDRVDALANLPDPEDSSFKSPLSLLRGYHQKSAERHAKVHQNRLEMIREANPNATAPNELTGAGQGLASGAGQIVSTLVRPFSSETADQILREQSDQAAAQQMAVAQSNMSGPRKFLNRVVPSAAASAGQALVLSPLGTAGVIGGLSLSTANDAYTTARDAGLPHEEAVKYAIEQGGIEGGTEMVTAGLGKLVPGLGGLKSMMTKEAVESAAKATPLQTLMRGFKELGGETLQEMPATALQNYSTARSIPGQEHAADWTDENGSVLNSPMVQSLTEAGASAGLSVAGAAAARQAAVKADKVRQFVAQPSRKNYEALPEELKQGPANQAQRQALAEQLQQQGATVPESNFVSNNTPAVSPEEQEAIDENNRITALKSPGAQPDFVPPTEAQATVPSSSSGEEVIPSAVQGQPEAAPTQPQLTEADFESMLNELQGVPAAQATVPENTEVTNEQVSVQQEEQGRQGRERLLDRTAARNQQRSWTQTVPDSLAPTTLPPVRNASDFDHAAEIAKRKESEATPEPIAQPNNPEPSPAASLPTGPAGETGSSPATSTETGTAAPQPVDARDEPTNAVSQSRSAGESSSGSNAAVPVSQYDATDTLNSLRAYRNKPKSIDAEELANLVSQGLVIDAPVGKKKVISKSGADLLRSADVEATAQRERERSTTQGTEPPRSESEPTLPESSPAPARPDAGVAPVPPEQGRYSTYPINTSQGPRIAVQNGDKPGLGDTVHESQEAAEKYAAAAKTRDEENAASRARDAAKATSDAEQKAKTDQSLNEYLESTGHAAMQKGKVRGALIGNAARRSTSEGKTYQGRRDAVVRDMVKDGWSAETREVPAVKEVSRTKYNRMDGKEQDAYEKRRAEAGSKTEYVLVKGDSTFTVTKAEHDYADWLNKKDSPAPTNPDVPPVQGQTAESPKLEPWQMTREDWVEHRLDNMTESEGRSYKTSSGKWHNGRDQVRNQAEGEWFAKNEEAAAAGKPVVVKPSWMLTQAEEDEQYGNGVEEHRMDVERAVKLGFPVPAKVLAEYPDLQKKAQGQAAEAPVPASEYDPLDINANILGGRVDQMLKDIGKMPFEKAKSAVMDAGVPAGLIKTRKALVELVRKYADANTPEKRAERARRDKIESTRSEAKRVIENAEANRQKLIGAPIESELTDAQVKEPHSDENRDAVQRAWAKQVKAAVDQLDLTDPDSKALAEKAKHLGLLPESFEAIEAKAVPASVPPENAPVPGISDNLRKSIDESLKTMSPDEIVGMLTKRAKFSPSANESLEGVKAYLADKQGPVPAKAEVAQGPKKEPWQTKIEEVKQQYPGSIVVIRHEDVYKLLGDDAKVASKVLGLSLTVKGAGSDNKNAVVTAGFPYYSLEGHLHKLINAGYRVSIAEDPTGKKDAKRDITVAESSIASEDLKQSLSVPAENLIKAAVKEGAIPESRVRGVRSLVKAIKSLGSEGDAAAAMEAVNYLSYTGVDYYRDVMKWKEPKSVRDVTDWLVAARYVRVIGTASNDHHLLQIAKSLDAAASKATEDSIKHGSWNDAKRAFEVYGDFGPAALLDLMDGEPSDPKRTEPTSYQRTTPVPGSPERLEIEARAKTLDESIQKMDDEYEDLDKKYQKAGYGTKLKESLSKRLDKLREKTSKHKADNDYDGLREKKRLMWLEDVATQSQVKSEGSTSTGKDKANAIAARYKILSDVNTDSSRGEQKRLREQINEMALKEAKGQGLTGEDAEKAARSASLYIMDFPGSRSLSEMISGEVRSLEATKSHEGASKAIEALSHLDSYRKKHYREQLDKYNAGTNERVLQQATQENKDKAAAAKTANGIKEAADLEEFRKAWSDTVPNRTNVADMLSKEGYINAKVGDKPAISNARWVILSDALPKTLKTRAETVGETAKYSGRVQNVGEMFEMASKGAVPLTLVGHEKLSDKPKSKGKKTTPPPIGKAVLTDGEYTIDIDEGYYNYLSTNGFEFRGRPSVIKKTPGWGAEAALALYKDGELAGIIMPMGRDDTKKNETLESLKQRIEQARAAAPKDTIADKAEAARQEFSESAQEFRKAIGGTLPNIGSFSPEALKAFTKMSVKAINAGALTFAEYTDALTRELGDMVESLRPLMVQMWPKIAARQGLDPSIEFDEGAFRRDTEPEEPGNDSEPDQPTLFEEPPKPPKEPGNGATPEGSIPDPLATKHADSDATREAMGLPPRTLAGDHAEHKWKRLAERANAASKGEIDGLIADLVETPRILTDYEDALISRRQTEVINAYEESQRRLAEASAEGNAAQVVAFQNESRARAAEEAILLGILDPGGTAAGRALAHRKAAIQRDYSVARMILNYRAEHANAEPSQANLDRWAEMEAKVKEAVDRAEKSDAAREAAEQALAIEKVHSAAVAEVETEKKTKTVTDVVKTGIEKARKRIENGFKLLGAMRGKVYSIESAAGDLTLALTEIARGYTELGVFSFVDAMKRFSKRVGDEAESMRGDFKRAWDQHIAENGVGDIRDQIDPENPSSIGTVAKRLHQFVIERDGLGKSAEDRDKAVAGVHELLHEAMPELTLEQTGRILSGKDEPTRRLSEEEIRAEHRAQLQILEDIKSWRNNQRPNAIQESRPSSEEQRKLRRIKAEARKNAKIEETEADEKTQLKSALDSAKIAMRNRIDDLSEAVRSREPIVHSKTAQRTDAQLDDLRKERDEWKKKYDEIFGKKELSDEQRAAALERALDRQIAQLEDDIPKGILYPPPKQPKLPISNPAIALKMARRDELVARRNELRVMSGEQEQRQMAAYERTLATRLRFWQERMSQGDFGPKPPKEPRKLTDKAASLQYEIEKAKEAFANEQERWRIANRTTAEKFKDFAGNAWDFRRDIVSTGEMSPFGRQGMMYVSGHWLRAAKAIAQSVSVLFQRNANEALSKINQSILDRPNAKAGFYKDVPFATKLNQRTAQEEIMIGEWAKRIPVLGRIVKRFGASGEAFLNLARADMMDAMLSTIGAVPGKVSPAEVKVLANAAGVFTGHGNVDPGVAKVLNKVVYSSLFTMSRIELAVGRPLWSGTAKTRLAIGREYVRSAAGLCLLSQMMRFALAALGDDDEEVKQEIDPRSSDFGKLKSKGTRIDMLGGESQILVLLTRLLSHEKAQDGVVSPLGSTFGGTDEAKLILNFMRSRLHPTMSSLLNRFIFKEDVIGERPRDLSEYDPTTTEGLQNIATENSPMAYADMVEAVQELGYPQGLLAATAAFFGAGLNTYGGSEQDSLKSIALKAAGAMSSEDKTKATSGVMKGYTTPEFLRVGVDQAKKALRDARSPQARRDAENALRKAQDAVDAAKGGDVTVESARDQLRKRFKTREDMVRAFREAYKEKHGNAASDGFFDALDRLPKLPGSISPTQKREMFRDLDEMTLREQQADYVRRHPGRTPPSTVRKYERRDDGTLDFNKPLKGYKTLRRRIESL